MLKILIADDSVLLQNRLESLIRDIGNLEIVGYAKSTSEALESAGTLNPDIMISDIRMPGGGGIELIRNVKARYPKIQVIVYTNYPFPQYRQKCLQLGAKYFFDKTSESEMLSETLKSIARGLG